MQHDASGSEPAVVVSAIWATSKEFALQPWTTLQAAQLISQQVALTTDIVASNTDVVAAPRLGTVPGLHFSKLSTQVRAGNLKIAFIMEQTAAVSEAAKELLFWPQASP
jgi:hypothetical protein